MPGWRYSGFSVHNQVRVAAEDAEGRRKLADTMLRAPLSLARSGQTRAGFTITQVVHAPNARRPAHAKPNPPRANPVQARLAPNGGHEPAAGG
jgi:hypothetical protein